MYRDDLCAVCGESLPPDHLYCREHAAIVDDLLHEAPTAGRADVQVGDERDADAVELLGQIPLETDLRVGGDSGMPLVLSHPDSPAGAALRGVAERLAVRRRGLAGMSLGIDTTRNV